MWRQEVCVTVFFTDGDEVEMEMLEDDVVKFAERAGKKGFWKDNTYYPPHRIKQVSYKRIEYREDW